MVKGSSGDKVNAIATMEGVEVFAKTAPRRFLARTLCNPLRAGISQLDDEFEEAEDLSLGGGSWQGEVSMVDLGPCKTSTPATWTAPIGVAAGGTLVGYTNVSRDL